jgi:SET domain-containing protein
MRNITDHRSFILKPSTIKSAGVGVFALHDIKEGTYMSLFSESFEEEVQSIKDVPEELQIYCIDQENGTLLCPRYFNRLDIGNYLNHSTKPNLRYEEGRGYYSVRNIKAGEELFADYRELGEPKDTWDAYYTN